VRAGALMAVAAGLTGALLLPALGLAGAIRVAGDPEAGLGLAFVSMAVNALWPLGGGMAWEGQYRISTSSGTARRRRKNGVQAFDLATRQSHPPDERLAGLVNSWGADHSSARVPDRGTTTQPEARPGPRAYQRLAFAGSILRRSSPRSTAAMR
jgi:hypothetical protein